MRGHLIILSVLAALLLCGSCSEEKYEYFGDLYGTVTDAATGEAVFGANVTLSPGGATERTDSTGYYQFQNLEPGQYSVAILHDEYKTDRKTITVIVGERIAANFALTK